MYLFYTASKCEREAIDAIDKIRAERSIVRGKLVSKYYEPQGLIQKFKTESVQTPFQWRKTQILRSVMTLNLLHCTQ